MKTRILWIEGKRVEGPPFIAPLRKKGFTVETVSTGAAAINRLKEWNKAAKAAEAGGDPPPEAMRRLDDLKLDLVVVNAASLGYSGKRICRSIREQRENIPILIITGAGKPAEADSCANVTLALPFTARKLMNHILPLLPRSSEMQLHTGPIQLDMERKQVRCEEREARLTPRLAQLLKILMDHPGEVLERERLFREVWKTEYTADTRTLDVHISWLREALEADPRKPVYLKTVRGVGYRLDV